VDVARTAKLDASSSSACSGWYEIVPRGPRGLVLGPVIELVGKK
jgi:hypothetical protein